MKIVVCIRLGADGEPGPFDACAYEAALRIEGAEITLLSMAGEAAKEPLLRLTRLGAQRAVLLSDRAFAGADTLATAKTLAAALKRLSPDLVITGRQTLIGDTAQTGPMLAVLCGYPMITNVMSVDRVDAGITCTTRTEGQRHAPFPALITVERFLSLRFPRLRSRMGELTVWNAAELGLSPDGVGLAGSPTRVLRTFENQSGRRKCRMIRREALPKVISEALAAYRTVGASPSPSPERLSRLCTVGEAPMEFAKSVSDDITVIPMTDAATVAEAIAALAPSAVLWGSDAPAKQMAAEVAARLSLGLCADCTRLEAENGALMMYRPALSGSTVAKIKSLTRPAMATVRTASEGHTDVVVGLGYGVKDELARAMKFAEALGAETVASRKLVDNGYLPYEMQLGLTGKTLSPPVYIAIGISGAVHHTVGMQGAATVIAINPDKDAPIFDYADFGIIENF